MIIIRHKKINDMSYVSQKDTQKTLQRGLKRAKIEVAYSQGYVPHMLTYSSTPLPLGIQSTCEYFGLECTGIDNLEFFARYNANMPAGLQAIQAWECAKNPNVAGNVVASDYLIKSCKPFSLDILDILKSEQYKIDVSKKGELTQKDIRPLIFDIQISKNEMLVRLACGNINLRIDNFTNDLNQKYDSQIFIGNITRTAQLAKCENGFFDIEEKF